MAIYPKQNISTKEKLKILDGDNFPIFLKNTGDYYIHQSLASTDDYDEMVSLYRAAAGILDEVAYKYVLNPYNTENNDYTSYPAKIRDYSIIKPIVKLFVGENDKRPHEPQVIVLNSDSINKYTEVLNSKVYNVLKQGFVNKLNDLGVNTGVETKQVPTVEQVVAEHKANYSDERAIQGQEALDYLRYNCDLDDKYQDAFYDWIVTGRVYTYKEIYRNDVHIRVVSPLEMWSSRDGGTNFVEDDSAVVRKFRLSANAIIDRFRSELTEEQVDYLDGLKNGGNSTQILTPPVVVVKTDNLDNVTSTAPQQVILNNGLIDMFHVTWKTFKEVGILNYIDPMTDQIEEREVDDTYVMNKELGDISIDWEYINEYWEVWRAGQNIYFGGNPLLAQRDELNNSSTCKSCYNGRINQDRLGNISSPVKNGLNYNVLHNIYHYRLERTLAKNKDNILMLPIGMIPEKWEMDKFMYEVDATGIAWFDETKPNAVNILNSIRTVNAGLATYAKDMIFFINSIKQEYWDSEGVNAQRYGDVQASEGKGNVEQAIFRSAVITSEDFRKFDKFREKDSDGALDYSKVAWINGKKGMYINSDNRKVLLNIDGTSHMESEYKVFCKNSDTEARKLSDLKQIAHAQVQKTGKIGLSAEVIDANNFSKVKDIIKRGEEIEQALIEQAVQKQQQSDERIAEMNKEAVGTKAESDKYKVDTEYKKAIDVALIQADIATMSLSGEPNADVQNEQSQHDLDTKRLSALAANRLNEANIQHNNLKVASENYNKAEDRKMQDKEIQSREKVAKMKKPSSK